MSLSRITTSIRSWHRNRLLRVLVPLILVAAGAIGAFYTWDHTATERIQRTQQQMLTIQQSAVILRQHGVESNPDLAPFQVEWMNAVRERNGKRPLYQGLAFASGFVLLATAVAVAWIWTTRPQGKKGLGIAPENAR